MNRWRGYIEKKTWNASYTLRLARNEPDGSRSIVQRLTFKTYPAMTPISDDDVVMETGDEEVRDFLRCLMNLAWEDGIRPDGFADHTNELKAVRYHLEDMRKLGLASK